MLWERQCNKLSALKRRKHMLLAPGSHALPTIRMTRFSLIVPQERDAKGDQPPLMCIACE